MGVDNFLVNENVHIFCVFWSVHSCCSFACGSWMSVRTIVAMMFWWCYAVHGMALSLKNWVLISWLHCLIHAVFTLANKLFFNFGIGFSNGIALVLYHVYWYYIFNFIMVIYTFVHLWPINKQMHNLTIHTVAYFVSTLLVFGVGSPVITPISSPRPVAPNINDKNIIIYLSLCNFEWLWQSFK